MTPHHSHHATLCASPHCRDRGRHTTNCPGGTCPGCLPRRAADGLQLCWPHVGWLEADARQAAELYDELALALTGGTGHGGRISGSPDRTRLPNPAAMEARGTIRAVLASWCRLISEERGIALPTRRVVEQLPPGVIGPPRLLTAPDDTVAAMGAYIARHTQWLAAHPAAGEAADELRELVRVARRIAYPDGTRVVNVGPCPHDGCGGTIRALLRRADSLLPSAIVCDADEQHEWPADQWLTLGRQIRKVAQ